MPTEELAKVAKSEEIEEYTSLPKQKLVFEVLKARARKQGLMMGEGSLAILRDGFGFLRSPEYSYQSSPDDVYVSPSQIRRFGLRKGQVVRGLIRPPKETETYFALLRVEEVNGRDTALLHDLPTFENLTPLHPDHRFILETGPQRALVGELTESVRKIGLRMGFYYSFMEWDNPVFDSPHGAGARALSARRRATDA